MAKGFVVATALGTELENYSGTLAGAECACTVCKAVYNVASQYSAHGFRSVKDVSYSFLCRELKLTLDNGSYVTMDVFLEMDVDANAAVRNVLREMVFPLFMQEHSIA